MSGGRDHRDLLGAGLLLSLGLFIVIYASANYRFGTFDRMGPGMFPALLGGLLIVLSFMIALPASLRLKRQVRVPADAPAKPVEPVRWQSLMTVTASVAALAAIVPHFGMVPAIFALTVIVVLGDRRLRPLPAAALATSLSVLIWAIFTLGLGVALPVVRWPF